ncbi:hypothetical protein F5Y10DRAFT_72554 [Nemania abortiva]|nr:hypothetical protein F5Y10DRAFT_72554 [Nemania abortiva]
MASVRKELVPDESVFFGIFNGAVDFRTTSHHVLANTFDTCTFRVHCEVAPFADYPKDLVVRLETSKGFIAGMAVLQRLARTQLPDLVPPILGIGTTTTADEREVDYCVIPYYLGTSPLDDVWDTLDETHQFELMASISHAVEKLQKLDLSSVDQSLIANISHENSKTPIGGPKLGYFPNIEQLLHGILQARISRCELSTIEGGIALQSPHKDIGRVELTLSELEELQDHVVFCHNDLESRNILVREIPSKDSSPRYEIAAIIDWEMAGFYPFAYEYCNKDLGLGLSNLSFSWYSQFKQQTSHMLPQAYCHTKLIKLLNIIDESQKRRMTRNVGVNIRIKWMERQQIEKSSDPRRGFVRKDGTQSLPFTKDDQEALELEVLEALGYK